MRKGRATRFAVASVSALLVSAAAIILVMAPSSSLYTKRANAILMKKGDPDAAKVGRSAETVETGIGPNDQRDPDSTPDIQAYLERAYPDAGIPVDATIRAQNGWASLTASAHSPGTW